MSGIITLNPQDKVRGLYEDFLLLVADAGGFEVELLSEECKALAATVLNVLNNSGFMGFGSVGQPIMVRPSDVIQSAAKQVRIHQESRKREEGIVTT